MKKTLLAAALLTGFAGVASAQNSVTLYGGINIGINYDSLKAGSAAPNLDTKSNLGMVNGAGPASRWGIRGVEDLGNGLKANFVYEQAIVAPSGGGTGFTRQSTLGLTSDAWGSVDLGRRTAPSTAAFSGIDPFGASYGTSSLNGFIGSSFYRLSNMVMYSSPSVSGFRAFAGYSFNTDLSIAGSPDNTTVITQFGSGYKSRATSLGLRYANGPILLAATFDNIQAPASRVAEPAANTLRSWALGGTYDLKVVKLHAAYSQTTQGILNNSGLISSALGQTAGDTNTTSNVVFVDGGRSQSWMVGVSAPLGSGSLFASVQQQLPGGNLKGNLTANELGASVGYRYSMSSRTSLYAYYSYVNNLAMVKDATSSQLGVGVTHNF
jgi:GBP family porin